MALPADVLENVLGEWIGQWIDLPSGELEAVAIDGKTLRSTLGEHGRSIQLLAQLDQQTGCVLSQMQVPITTNEHKAALELLQALVQRLVERHGG